MSAVLRATPGAGDGAGPGRPFALAGHPARWPATCSIGLWVFIGVATTLFSLFIVAYVMRLANAAAPTPMLLRPYRACTLNNKNQDTFTEP